MSITEQQLMKVRIEGTIADRQVALVTRSI
ncbi:hypothetical protein PS623_00422 [Pseudomonas fluorescens]|nr:hypothetical protein PS623_00422 [Pseudomonas fluorescens]